MADIAATQISVSRVLDGKDGEIPEEELVKIDTAVSTANAASTVAGEAKTTASEASTKADTAQSTADNAVTRIESLEADHVKVSDLTATNARVETLEGDHVKVSDLTAATGRITTLETDTADISTIRANSAKVANLTAAQLEADHATVGSLEANYAKVDMANVNNAWIESGVIKSGAISDAMIGSVSANKLTAGTIDASKINVTNLNADNLTVGTINGARIGTDSISLDKLTEEVPTKAYLDSVEEKLQGEIDGAIQTFTETAVPTLENAPAVDWTTDDIKDDHIGDLCYIVNSSLTQDGYCYRFAKVDGVYQWVLLKDSDVTKAIKEVTELGGEVTKFETETASWHSDAEDEISSVKTRTTTIETTYATKSYAETQASGALTDAKSYTDTQANTAESNAKAYADTKVDAVAEDLSTNYSKTGEDTSYDKAGSASTAQSNAEANAKSYTDTAVSTKVEESVFNELSQTVDTNSASITTLKNIATLNGLTESTKLTETVNSVKQTADTNTSSISSLTTTVANNKTSIENRASTIEQSLTGVTTRVSSIENWEIGGRNLFANSLQTDHILYSDSDYRTITFNGWGKTQKLITNIDWNVHAITQLVLSMYLKPIEISEDDGTICAGFQIYYTDGTFTQYLGGINWLNDNKGYKVGEEGYCRLKCAIPSDKVISYINVTVRNQKNTQTSTCQYREIKLEQGMLPTAWTPAPEDTDSDISSLDTRVTTAESKITDSAIVNTVTSSTTYKNDLSGKVDTSTYSSKMTQLDNSISLKATASEVYTKTQADSAFDASGSASSALSSANAYTDTAKSSAISTASADAKSKADTALSSAKSYTDTATDDMATKTYVTSQGYLTVESDAIKSKVEKNGVISAIEQTSETIKISASHLNITGAVTFDSLDTSTQTKINGKADASSLSAVATSGSYSDLDNQPTIPSKVSELQNDNDFQTAEEVNDTVTPIQELASTAVQSANANGKMTWDNGILKIDSYDDAGENFYETEIGGSGIRFRYAQSAEQVRMDSAVVAEVNQQYLKIRKTVVLDEMVIGEWVWQARSDGRLELKWKGSDS